MRTIKEFVKQLMMEGKSPEHIRAVAQCTHWSSKINEVDMWIEKGKKIMKKKHKTRKIKIKRKSS